MSRLSLEDLRFNEFLASAIDGTLNNVLGEKAKKATLTYLKEIYSLELENCCEKLEMFDSVLRKLFGSVAEIIENQITKEVYQQINSQNPENETFLTAISNARNEYFLMLKTPNGFQTSNFEYSKDFDCEKIQYCNYARTLTYLATSLMALYMTSMINAPHINSK